MASKLILPAQPTHPPDHVAPGTYVIVDQYQGLWFRTPDRITADDTKAKLAAKHPKRKFFVEWHKE